MAFLKVKKMFQRVVNLFSCVANTATPDRCDHEHGRILTRPPGPGQLTPQLFPPSLTDLAGTPVDPPTFPRTDHCEQTTAVERETIKDLADASAPPPPDSISAELEREVEMEAEVDGRVEEDDEAEEECDALSISMCSLSQGEVILSGDETFDGYEDGEDDGESIVLSLSSWRSLSEGELILTEDETVEENEVNYDNTNGRTGEVCATPQPESAASGEVADSTPASSEDTNTEDAEEKESKEEEDSKDEEIKEDDEQNVDQQPREESCSDVDTDSECGQTETDERTEGPIPPSKSAEELIFLQDNCPYAAGQIPPTVPSNVSPKLRALLNMSSPQQRPNLPPQPRREGKLKFTSPLLAHSDFSLHVSQQNVSLETATLSHREVVGYVRVANLRFEKNVGVRYSSDGWKSYKEARAEWVETVEDGKQDRFQYSFPSPCRSKQVQFNVFYDQFLDSNGETNYTLEF